MRRAGPLIATTIIVGFVLGAAISVLAFYVARYGPSGGNWSFKGNGALAVYPAFPAVMAAGWTGLVLHARGAALALQQAGHVEAVGAHRTEPLRLPEHGQDEARVVGLAVVEQVAAGRLAGGERG